MCEKGLTMRMVELVGYTNGHSKIQLGTKSKALNLKAKTGKPETAPGCTKRLSSFGERAEKAEDQRINHDSSRAQKEVMLPNKTDLLCQGQSPGWRRKEGVTLAHGQDIWIDVHENHEFPDSP